ncbi:MAG: LemA family protein [Bacteroidetes bacterium]|uniref:LemA family protein n=1 Tax=Candidatus Cryptobacteroides avicola TaxID=2840757 RepID=A0A940DSA3_9BACT|nr:LemA family protein [Candidatus Cryptobacteroides avicola]
MKKSTLITVTAIVIIVLALFFWVKNSYNGLVKADEQVKAAWSQVENVYQRRADLIPNLVATVKGYAEHESETLESVVEARSKATQVSVDPENLDPDRIAEYQAAQGELSQALGRLIMLQENYPDLKANQNFRDLQAQLEGTENRIATERMKFNETARSYNTMVRSFPKNIFASMFGFEAKGYFEASEGAQTAPKVEF